MNNLVGLVRNEVGEMTNDLISQAQVSSYKGNDRLKLDLIGSFFRSISSALKKKRN
mgnify:CR=1 FL=1